MVLFHFKTAMKQQQQVDNFPKHIKINVYSVSYTEMTVSLQILGKTML